MKAALPYSKSSCEHFRKHYVSPDAERPFPDIQRRVDVCGISVSARNAFEGGLTGSVSFVRTSARVAFARRVTRIYKTDRHADSLCLVGNASPEIAERPIHKPCSLIAAGRNPVSDALKVFHGNSATGAFSIVYEQLRYAVVGVVLESPLFTGKFSKTPLGSFASAFLQAISSVGMLKANLFYPISGVDHAITIGSEIDYSEVNAKPIICIEFCSLWDIAGCRQHPFPAHKAQVNLTLSERHQPPLVVAHDYRNFYAPIQRPDADGSSAIDETDNTIVVRLCGAWSKVMSSIAASFESIRNLSDRSDSGLSAEPEFCSHLCVRDIVQIKLPERARIKADIGKPGACLVAPLKRSSKKGFLLMARQQFDCGDQLHEFKNRIFATVSQRMPATIQ